MRVCELDLGITVVEIPTFGPEEGFTTFFISFFLLFMANCKSQKVTKFMTERILQVPKQVIGITHVNDRFCSQSESAPFFGHAPGETPEWLVNCPHCGASVLAAHFNVHMEMHDAKPQDSLKNSAPAFRIPTESKFSSSISCPYAERQAYIFKTMFDRDGK